MTTLPRPTAEPKPSARSNPNTPSTRGEQYAFYFFMGAVAASVLMMVYLLFTL